MVRGRSPGHTMPSRRAFLRTVACVAPAPIWRWWPQPAAGSGSAARSGVVRASPTVRPAAFAGQFYPDDAGRLRAALDAFMRDALPARVDQPVAIVVPHAGYVYSGQIAADAYRQAAAGPVDVVVILGTNHTNGAFRRVSVYDGEGYRTPLGVARVDRQAAEALVGDGGGVFDSRLHEREHSVEVQVPFVQHLFPGAAIVPVVVGAPDPEACRRFGLALAAFAAGRRTLMVASSRSLALSGPAGGRRPGSPFTRGDREPGRRRARRGADPAGGPGRPGRRDARVRRRPDPGGHRGGPRARRPEGHRGQLCEFWRHAPGRSRARRGVRFGGLQPGNARR